MPSDAVVNTLGAIGGGVLAGCLAPQLWKLWQTRSARDLSYAFLLFFNLGLICSLVYLVLEDAFVAWLCIVIEIGFVSTMIAAKFFLDNWGPHSQRALKQARPESQLTNSTSFASEVRMEVHDVAAVKAGRAEAWDPLLLRPAATHEAQQLLLDCRLAMPCQTTLVPPLLPMKGSTGGASAVVLAMPAGADAAAEKQVDDSMASVESDDEMKDPTSTEPGKGSMRAGATSLLACPEVLAAVTEMLGAALAAAGLPVQRRQCQTLPSFSGCSGSHEEALAAAEAHVQGQGQGEGEEAAPGILFLACKGGYCTAIWYCRISTLSLNFMAASDGAVASMGAAAQHLCWQLSAGYPGTQIVASSVGRMARP